MKMNVKKFFESQYKAYATYDSERSIANAIDGQKITARKVLHTCSNRGNSEIKVAQLCSQVAYETAYHHGEAGIGGVICNLAQNFAGANNINLLEPIGQFGSRLSPIPAAHRYIFTKLSSDFRKYFKKEDELVLDYLYDDDQKIEPKFFIPILPMVLINGTQGIGTGFASKVLSYNPKDVQEFILKKLSGKKTTKLVPWFNKFSGTVEQGDNSSQWVITGKLEVVDSTTIKITELPIGTYLDDVKSTLAKLKEKELIRDYDDNSTEDQFDITVSCPRSTTSLPIEKLYEHFKLISKESENITLWNHLGKLQVFADASELIEYFIGVRLTKYEDRRQALIIVTEDEIVWLDERIRFIQFYLDNTVKFKNTGKKELIELLETNDFTRPNDLLSMSIWYLTKDKINELNDELNKKVEYLESLNKDTANQMFERELKELKV